MGCLHPHVDQMSRETAFSPHGRVAQHQIGERGRLDRTWPLGPLCYENFGNRQPALVFGGQIPEVGQLAPRARTGGKQVDQEPIGCGSHEASTERRPLTKGDQLHGCVQWESVYTCAAARAQAFPTADKRNPRLASQRIDAPRQIFWAGQIADAENQQGFGRSNIRGEQQSAPFVVQGTQRAQ